MADIAFEPAPGEIRAILFENGVAVELHSFRPGHGALGTVSDARIITKSGPRAYLRLSGGEEALLNISPGQAEGATIRVEIIREQMSEPGNVKLAVVKASEDALTSGDAATRWQAALTARADAVIAADTGFDDHFDSAFTGRSDADGATIWFERTKAGLVFDVDGIGDARAVNRAAAAEIARLLRLFQIGGAAIIDFLGMENRQARTDIANAFDAASAADPRGFERTAVNGFGLMQVIRAKSRPSLLDTLCGVRRASASDQTMLLQLLREAARSQGVGIRHCVTAPALAAQLGQTGWQSLVDEVARSVGARVEIVADASVRGYGHVHVNPA